MAVSEKKRLANRANARKSTGPRSKDGKAKVALNSIRHGLRSKEVVLPGEDAQAFDQMLASWMDDWQPPTDARRVLIEQAVAHAWRLRRCLKVERDHLIGRGLAAVRADDRAASVRIDAALARLAADPAGSLRALLAERRGAEVILGLWRELAEAATTGGWSDMDGHHDRMIHLLGYAEGTCADEIGGPAMASWRLIEWNQPEPTDFAEDAPADEAEADAHAEILAEFIGEQIAEIESYLARFPTAEADAARLMLSASLDDSPAGRALLRYEGQHGREFRATLNQLIKLTQTGVDLAEDEPESEPQAVSDPMVEAEAAPAPSKATEAAVAAPSKATEGPTEGVPDDDSGPIGPSRTVAGPGEHRPKQQV